MAALDGSVTGCGAPLNRLVGGGESPPLKEVIMSKGTDTVLNQLLRCKQQVKKSQTCLVCSA